MIGEKRGAGNRRSSMRTSLYKSFWMGEKERNGRMDGKSRMAGQPPSREPGVIIMGNRFFSPFEAAIIWSMLAMLCDVARCLSPSLLGHKTPHYLACSIVYTSLEFQPGLQVGWVRSSSSETEPVHIGFEYKFYIQIS